MKRREFKLIVFLLAGAIINVAIAWGCALQPISANQIALNAEALEWLRAHDERPSVVFGGQVTSSFGRQWLTCCLLDAEFENRTRQKMKDFQGGSAFYPAPPFQANRIVAGWPLRSVHSYEMVHTADWSMKHPIGTARSPAAMAYFHSLTGVYPHLLSGPASRSTRSSTP